MRKPAAAVSLAMHVIAAILLFTTTFAPKGTIAVPPAVARIFLTPAPKIFKPDGGGGQRQPMPARQGHIEVTTRKVWIPPMVTPPESPKLVVIAAMDETPEYNLSVPQIGDPFGKSGLLSGGPGLNGIGGPGKDGVGVGTGPHSGGPKISLATYTGKLTRDPQLIYKEEPEFSDEARKARHEGTVIIDLDIDASGRPVNIRVIRGLGMGLDERALAAVAHWKFRPAMAGDRAVAAPARVQVSFHLL